MLKKFAGILTDSTICAAFAAQPAAVVNYRSAGKRNCIVIGSGMLPHRH